MHLFAVGPPQPVKTLLSIDLLPAVASPMPLWTEDGCHSCFLRHRALAAGCSATKCASICSLLAAAPKLADACGTEWCRWADKCLCCRWLRLGLGQQAGSSLPLGKYAAICCRGRRSACLLPVMAHVEVTRCCMWPSSLALVSCGNEGTTPLACHLMSAALLLEAA